MSTKAKALKIPTQVKKMTKGALEVALVRAQEGLQGRKKQAAVYAHQLSKLNERIDELEACLRTAHNNQTAAQSELTGRCKEFTAQLQIFRAESDSRKKELDQYMGELTKLREQIIADDHIARAREKLLRDLMDTMTEKLLLNAIAVTVDGTVYWQENGPLGGDR